DRYRFVDVAALHAIARVEPELHFEIQVARRPAAEAGGALSGEADLLAFGKPLGDAHVEHALVGHGAAPVVETCAAQLDRAGGAVVDVGQVDQDARVAILAAHPVRAARAAAASGAAEQAREEVAERLVAHVRPAGARELEASAPIGRRLELLAGAVAVAELVVGGTLRRIGQHRVGLVDLAHASLGV